MLGCPLHNRVGGYFIHGIDNLLEEGEMLLLEPQDGHMSCIKLNEFVHVKKSVFKIPVDK